MASGQGMHSPCLATRRAVMDSADRRRRAQLGALPEARQRETSHPAHFAVQGVHTAAAQVGARGPVRPPAFRDPPGLARLGGGARMLQISSTSPMTTPRPTGGARRRAERERRAASLHETRRELTLRVGELRGAVRERLHWREWVRARPLISPALVVAIGWRLGRGRWTGWILARPGGLPNCLWSRGARSVMDERNGGPSLRGAGEKVRADVDALRGAALREEEEILARVRDFVKEHPFGAVGAAAAADGYALFGGALLADRAPALRAVGALLPGASDRGAPRRRGGADGDGPRRGRPGSSSGMTRAA